MSIEVVACIRSNFSRARQDYGPLSPSLLLHSSSEEQGHFTILGHTIVAWGRRERWRGMLKRDRRVLVGQRLGCLERKVVS